MLKKILFIITIFTFYINPAEKDVSIKDQSTISKVTIYFEDLDDAKALEIIFDKEESFLVLSTDMQQTENGGYCINILNMSEKQFKIIRKLFRDFKKKALFVFTKNGQSFALLD